MPATLTAPITNRRKRASSRYPTLTDPTKQALWIDFLNQSKTDTSGLVAATAGDSVWTVKLPTGWGSSSGDGLVRQDTSSKRAVLRSDGIQTDGSDDLMNLPATITLSGDFTIYYVASRSSTVSLVWVGRAADTFSLISFSDGNFYFWDGSAPRADTATGLRIRRVRRSGTTVTTTIGGTDATQSDSSTLTLNEVLSRKDPVNICTSSSARTLGLVIVSSHLTPGGTDDLRIIAALQALYSGVAGP